VSDDTPTPTLATMVGARDPFPLQSGKRVAVRDVSFRMRKLAHEVDEASDGPAQDEKLMQLARLCAPELTEEDVLDMSPQEALLLVAYASRRIDDLTAYLGNGPAPAASKPRPRRSR
jgi:hypothetical protein